MSSDKAKILPHRINKELKYLLDDNPKIKIIWNSLTPIARNEWICYITFPKKTETRRNHIKRFQDDLLRGKRRPCCWPGCPHRRPSAAKWFKK